jgi:hypothetical protein
MADETAVGNVPPAEDPSKKYDQAFFLDLAMKGKDAWNAWRRDPANEDVRVTFAGIDFSEAPRDRIDFSGFEFGDEADFSQCNWHGPYLMAFARNHALFTGAIFGSNAYFADAAFGNLTDFKGATFGHNASFRAATFNKTANFKGATFGHEASFGEATFNKTANFKGATFGHEASFRAATFGNTNNFKGATFGHEANFTGADFGKESWFDGGVFQGRVIFTGTSRKDWDRVSGVLTGNTDEDEKVQIARKKRHENLWECYGSGPDQFLRISFAGARFDDEAVFSGRLFKSNANFTNAHFYFPPDFDGADNVSRIDFTGTHIGFVPKGKLIHLTEDSRVPVRLRAFRKIAEETKNHDLERDLYIEERKAERGVYWRQRREELKEAPRREKPLIALRLGAHLFWIAVMGVYWTLADYGRSCVRPAAWLIASGYGFYRLYLWILAPMPSKVGPLDMEKYEHAVRMLALGNSVPFVGPLTIDADIKKFLFCRGFGNCTPTEGYQLLVISQNLISIILVFFIGLALRNYFKIK